jgi:hypothetical protein
MNPVTKGLGVFAALLPLVAVPTAAGAAQPALAGQPLPDTPATVLVVNPINGWVQALTGYPTPRPGFLCDPPDNSCVNITWPFPFIPEGVTAFDTAITAASGKTIIVFAYSQGTQIAEQWLKQHLNDPPKNLTFVLLGNSTRAYGGSLVEPSGGAGSPFAEVWPQSQYPVIDVARQYEFSADFPNNPSSLFYSLAVVNAILGGYYLHDYASVGNPIVINDPANTVWKPFGTNITYVLIPTENLPLLDPLRVLGLTPLADALNGPLKALVDQAYNRDYPDITNPGIISAGVINPGPIASTMSSTPDPALTLTLATPQPGTGVDELGGLANAGSVGKLAVPKGEVEQSVDPGKVDAGNGVESLDAQGGGLPVADLPKTPDPSGEEATATEEVKTTAPSSGAPGVPLFNVKREGMKAEPGQLGGQHRKPGGGLAGVVKSVQDTITNITNGLKGGTTQRGEDSPGEAGTE